MVNISKVISLAAKLQGTKGSFTLGKDALKAAAQAKGKKAEIAFSAVTSKLKDPAIDIAYKTSKQGYTVGAVTIRDGRKVVGNGAVSVTGLGTENSVVKYRLNIGQNGKVARANGFVDNSKQLTADDLSVGIKRKNGVTTIQERFGDAAGSNAIINENEYVKILDDAAGSQNATKMYKDINRKLNNYLAKSQQSVRDMLAGKDVDTIFGGNFKDMLLKKFKTAKKIKIKTPNQAAETVQETAQEAKKFVTVPSGEKVPIEEFTKHMQEYHTSLIETAQSNLKRGNDEMAQKLLKEAKEIASIAEKEGVKLKGDVRDFIPDILLK